VYNSKKKRSFFFENAVGIFSFYGVFFTSQHNIGNFIFIVFFYKSIQHNMAIFFVGFGIWHG